MMAFKDGLLLNFSQTTSPTCTDLKAGASTMQLWSNCGKWQLDFNYAQGTAIINIYDGK